MHRTTRTEDACDACEFQDHVAKSRFAGEADAGPPDDFDAGAARERASRRVFLHRAGTALASLVVLGAATSERLAALPVRNARGRTHRHDVSFPIPADDGITIDRANEIILVRWQSCIYAFALSCPHQRTMLKWREPDQRFQCPKHKSRYQPDGEFVSGRATRGMDRYEVRVTGGSAVVDTSQAIRQDENGAGWAAAFARLG